MRPSGPPSRPPPCQGGGVIMASPSRSPCFSLSLAGGGSGWGSRRRGYASIRTPLPTSPLSGGRSDNGLSLSLAGGGSGWGSRRRGYASIRTPLPTSPLSGRRSDDGLSLPLPLISPSPLQGEGRGGGRGAGGMRPSGPPSRPPPCQGGGERVAGGGERKGDPHASHTLPLSLFLPPPCRGRVGVGVAAPGRRARTDPPMLPSLDESCGQAKKSLLQSPERFIYPARKTSVVFRESDT